MERPAQAHTHKAFVRDEEIWFPDGNIVLEAEGCAFKVYKGLLSQNSEVFRNLLSISQLESAETEDKCPLVHLSDHPAELRHFLCVLFPGEKYHRSDEQLEFAVVAAVIRLSHKYQVHHVRDAYLARMKTCFPTDFDSWDMVNRNHGSLAMTLTDQHSIAAVDVARITGTASMLPGALYLCCRLHPNSILRGVPRWCDGPHEELRLDDAMRCMQGRLFVLQRAITNILELFDPGRRSPLCTQRRCGETLALMRAQHADGFAPRLVLDALQTREPHIRALQKAQYLCRNCADAVCEADVELCRRLWAKLPELMGVDTPEDWPAE